MDTDETAAYIGDRVEDMVSEVINLATAARTISRPELLSRLRLLRVHLDASLTLIAEVSSHVES